MRESCRCVCVCNTSRRKVSTGCYTRSIKGDHGDDGGRRVEEGSRVCGRCTRGVGHVRCSTQQKRVSVNTDDKGLLRGPCGTFGYIPWSQAKEKLPTPSDAWRENHSSSNKKWLSKSKAMESERINLGPLFWAPEEPEGPVVLTKMLLFWNPKVKTIVLKHKYGFNK